MASQAQKNTISLKGSSKMICDFLDYGHVMSKNCFKGSANSKFQVSGNHFARSFPGLLQFCFGESTFESTLFE